MNDKEAAANWRYIVERVERTGFGFVTSLNPQFLMLSETGKTFIGLSVNEIVSAARIADTTPNAEFSGAGTASAGT